MTPREPRYETVLPAKIRWDARWLPSTIRNVSTRGLMLRMPGPPPPGTYVEVQTPVGVLVARAMWTLNQSCGLRLQDRLDVQAILSGRNSTPRATSTAKPASVWAPRRQHIDIGARAERSKRLGALMQFTIVVGVGSCAAGSIAWEVYKTMSAPLTAIGKQMP